MLTMSEFAARLRTSQARIPAAIERTALVAARAAARRARSYVGTSQDGWPPLAPSTQAERIRQGWPADQPLLRTGEYRGTIDAVAVGPVGIIGSNDPRAAWFEYGTRHMPPRPHFSKAILETGPELEVLLVTMAEQVFTGR